MMADAPLHRTLDNLINSSTERLRQVREGRSLKSVINTQRPFTRSPVTSGILNGEERKTKGKQDKPTSMSRADQDLKTGVLMLPADVDTVLSSVRRILMEQDRSLNRNRESELQEGHRRKLDEKLPVSFIPLFTFFLSFFFLLTSHFSPSKLFSPKTIFEFVVYYIWK